MHDQLDKVAKGASPRGGKTSRSHRLHELIREDIIDGRLAPGSRLKVSELADYYGTSTNPVREALNRLEGEGVVVITQNRGARVRAIDEDFIRNIYEIRILIEPYLVRWFVDYAKESEIKKLREIQEEIDEIIDTDLERFNELNEQFHSIIYANHYNSEARNIIKRQEAMLHILSRRFGLPRSRKRAICQEHKQLIDAIESGNEQLAVEAEERHVRGSVELLLEQMRIHRVSAG
ncbi:GntR family transcriptional regulator [Modicisalibacter radicis]|uniref:GntR family transcriptional regulator n=1 Tax=Halomonas sp. EAR18 TaxID=2518972 RepID=UPI00109CA520|nr:GntR family transcriptional regulator [Halomonas sp. EAR18]